MPTYTVKLIMFDETIIKRTFPAVNIWGAIQTMLSIWCHPDDRVIEVEAYEETEA